MPPRTRLPDLAKLFDALDDPVYVVDDRRRIDFRQRGLRGVARANARRTASAANVVIARRPPTTIPLRPRPTHFARRRRASSGRYASAEIVAPGGDVAVRRVHAARRHATGAAAVFAWLPAPEIVGLLADDDRRRETESQRLHAVAAHVRRDLATRYAPDRLHRRQSGDCPRSQTNRTRGSERRRTSPIVGPAGVGKRHVARTIHALRVASLTSTDARAARAARRTDAQRRILQEHDPQPGSHGSRSPRVAVISSFTTSIGCRPMRRSNSPAFCGWSTCRCGSSSPLANRSTPRSRAARFAPISPHG